MDERQGQAPALSLTVLKAVISVKVRHLRGKQLTIFLFFRSTFTFEANPTPKCSIPKLMTEEPGEITLLLQRWRTGDPQAESRLFELLMPDLRRIAGGYFRKERVGHTLQPTALVNEAFLSLAAAKKIDWNDRGHFIAIAARMGGAHGFLSARPRSAGDCARTWPISIAAEDR